MTTHLKKAQINRKWHLIDLKGQVLGRVSVKIAKLLMGKDKPNLSAHLDVGDYVVVINASDIAITGKKESDKIYRHHTMHPGGFREVPFKDLMAKDPTKIIELAVKGMLPKNRLRDLRMKRLKIFKGAKHTYTQQFKEEVKE